MARQLTVEIFHDPDVESPCNEDGAWKLYSFSPRHLSYRHPDNFFPDGKPSSELQDKLKQGAAWILSYFEHGQCQWMLSDEPRDMLAGDWHWDGVDKAGVLVWEHPLDELGPRTKQARRADAAEFVEIYTSWCNGETYGYTITDSDGREVGEGDFLIGDDHLLASIRVDLNEGDKVVEVRDKVAGLTVEHFRR
jgi:hypothetical protein